MDATYKTNEYRLPLLEVVGVTSTNLTYSLMFAYLSNEKEDQLIWALSTVKNWMIGVGAIMPSVIVSDRDLALINAIERYFPMANHMLCVWHINENVVKKCSVALGPLLKRFIGLWHSLIMSSQPYVFQEKWYNISQEFKRYKYTLKYLEDTWLIPYKERFVAAWVNNYMHIGNNSTQRVESAHSRLKKYLGDTMSSLETSLHKIDKMMILQFGAIMSSFEVSLINVRHTHLNDNLYDQVRGLISHKALDLIDSELQSNASPHQSGCCECTIRMTHGLPCKHELALYRYSCIPIPFDDIHIHWTRLSVNIQELTNPSDQSSHIKSKDPSYSSIKAPSYSTSHKGRPTGKEELSRIRISSCSEKTGSNTSHAATPRSRPERRAVEQLPIYDPFIQHLPEALRGYITHTGNVEADGNCGFRAIAAFIGYGENGWARVRNDLIRELQTNMSFYNSFYLETGYANNLVHQLSWFESPAPPDYWMDSMTLECVIASKYNIVLHTFEPNSLHCFVHFPLRSHPVPIQERLHIATARVGQHFVQVFLVLNYPVPPIPSMWFANASNEANGWAIDYFERIQSWFTVMS